MKEFSKTSEEIQFTLEETNGNFQIKVKLKQSEHPNFNKQLSEASIFVNSFWFDGILTWAAIVLSIALYFYSQAGKLNFVFLVFDAILFTLNNKFIIEKNFTKFTLINYKDFELGPLGIVVFYLKVIPIVIFLFKNSQNKFKNFT